ncbi:MAG: glycosyltransferase [Bacteroidetes bacterium]|nr:glycosyltransferase [Bacteroidota bacterium]
MNILFYTPFNLRSRDTESLMEAFIKQGHNVILLTQAEEGVYHENCRKINVNVNTHVIKKKNSIIYFLKHTLYLIKFCKKNKIDVLYAHLETAGLPAVLAQPFVKAKVFACRHVIDEAYLFNSKNFVRLTHLVYFLAKNIIVVSNRCKQFMIEVEGIKEKKIEVIFLAYNFNLYKAPDLNVVNEIKAKYPADILLIVACRLVAPKRTELAINVTKKLIEKGISAKMIILGTGPDFEKIKEYIVSNDLTQHIFMEGFRLNVMDYLAASDVLIHPSLSDSSSVIIKEAGLNKKVVLACSGIGDVDDYLINGKNAILVSKENTEEEMIAAIENISKDKEQAKLIGQNLHLQVSERFSINTILPAYDKIHADIQKN